MTEASGGEVGSYLPDLCQGRYVLAVLLIAELFAIALVIVAPEAVSGYRLLGRYSLFIQWLTLSCVGALCLARGRLNRLPASLAGVLAWLLILVICLVVSLLAWWLFYAPPLSGRLQELPALLVRNLSITAIFGGLLLHYLHLRAQWEKRIFSESRARLHAMQARIRPHFLFNTLNTVAALVRDDPKRAERLIGNLCELFRVGFVEDTVRACLGQEFALCRRYLEIEQLRLGKRLRVEWQTEALPDDAAMPPLCLQPLLENAVYHGIELLSEGGNIRILGQRRNGRLQIDIENPRPRTAASDNIRTGHRLALDNVQARLQGYYGEEAGVRYEEREDRFRARIEFPYRPIPNEGLGR